MRPISEDCRIQRVGASLVLALLLAAPLAGWGAEPKPASDTSASASDDPVSHPDPDADEEEALALDLEVIEWDPYPKPPGPTAPDAWSLTWRNGIELRREAGGFRIRVGGRYLLDGAVFHQSRDIAGRSGWDQELSTRQARPDVRAAFFERFFGRVAYEFETGQTIDAYVGMRGLGPLGTLQVGYHREPFSLELRTSLLAQVFMERSIAQALSPDRNYGVLFTNTHFDRRFRWAIGGFYVSDEFEGVPEFRSAENSLDLSARISGLPIWKDEGKRLLLLGVSYSARLSIDEDPIFATRPESFFVPALVSTGLIRGAERYHRWGVESAWIDHSLSLQGEVLGLSLDREVGSQLSFWGGYLQAAYLLTGERRIYGRRSGTIGRVIPRKPFSRGRGQWGAVEVAARVSYLDLDDADVRGGRQFDVTLGLNWFLNRYVRIAANYVYADATRGRANILQARIQLEY